MKFCDDHWSKLRVAIEARGLTHLIKSGQENMESAVSELEGDGPTTYDPLMSAHWMIVNEALRQGGLYLMTGDYCPICEAIKHTPDVEPPWTLAQKESWWIDGPCDAVLNDCREKGLVSTS